MERVRILVKNCYVFTFSDRSFDPLKLETLIEGETNTPPDVCVHQNIIKVENHECSSEDMVHQIKEGAEQ